MFAEMWLQIRIAVVSRTFYFMPLPIKKKESKFVYVTMSSEVWPPVQESKLNHQALRVQQDYS